MAYLPMERRNLKRKRKNVNPGEVMKVHEAKSAIAIIPEKQIKENKSAVWRVIAPYVTITKKIYKEKEEEEDDEQFSFYLKKKPMVLLHDLSHFLSDSVDLPSLFHETSETLKKVTKAQGVTLYMVDNATNEIWESKKFLVEDRQKVRWKIELGTTIAAHVAATKQHEMVDDILMDARFPEGIGYEGDVIPKAVLCVPVVTPEGDCFAVIELYRRVYEGPFTKDDLKISVMVTSWMGVAIHQNQQRLALKRQQELNDYLLGLTKCYFGDRLLKDKLMMEVIQFAKHTLGAERGSLFIIDQETDEVVSHFFDEGTAGDISHKKRKKVRFCKERGIAGLVARTGVTVNIKDAYTDTRFNKEIDEKTGFITRSILCMPILSMTGVLGVVQVINKKNGGCFTSTDENLFKTFSVYCSIALHYSHVHSQISKTVKNYGHHQEINGFLMIHLNNNFDTLITLQQRPCIHDIQYFETYPTIPIPKNFETFSWYVESLSHLSLKAPQYYLYMVQNLMDPAEINVPNMMRFILTIKRLYRDMPYHNFEHAFNVSHCMYVILKNNLAVFSKIEIKAMILACLCHDVDHGGFTNNFLRLVNDEMAQLYDSSALENHHYQVTISVLNDCPVFNGFSEIKTKRLYSEIKQVILATDLHLFFEVKSKLMTLCQEKQFDWRNISHRQLVKAVMMNSCDLSGQCKPYEVAKRITACLYDEFYKQGDLEKKMGLCPLSLMDRDQQNRIPEDQIQFLKVVVIPCVLLLREFLPNTENLFHGAVDLQKVWEQIIANRGKKVWRPYESIVKM